MAYWKDIDLSLDKKNDGDIKDFENLDALISSLTNIIQTIQGSRRRLPTFASNPNLFLFDQIDDETAREIAENLLSAITDWDSRIIVDDITIIPQYDLNQYDLSLSIRGENTKGESTTIKTILYST